MLNKIKKFPWWLAAVLILGLASLFSAFTSPNSKTIFGAIVSGLGVTVTVSFIAFIIAIFWGLALAIMKGSTFRPIRELATFYIEIMRGLPMLVILYYIAFVGAPFLAQALNFICTPLINWGLLETFQTRNFDFTTRAVLALSLGYGAFIAEIFRAGIESISRGQIEAAQALGLSSWQSFRYVILPQAIKNVLPALANESIAIIKDSSLVSILGVQDITQIGKVYAASTFQFFETYNAVAFFYLSLTITLSVLVRRLEKKLGTDRH